MIYYNSTANVIDQTKVVQNITNKVFNALSNAGIQGYELRCTNIDIPTMSVSFEITHIGYPVEILFYNGTVFKRDSLFTVDYKSVIEMIKDGSLTLQQKEDAVDKRIESLNTSTAEMIYDQIKIHQVLKAFEKIVYDKYVMKKNFPNPEQMWEEFKAYYEAVKSIPSPIQFPCTIDDWWEKLEETIKKNTAFWNYKITRDESYRVNYGLDTNKSSFNPNYFTVYHNMYDVCSDESYDDEELGRRLREMSTRLINELNGIPAIVQSSIPTAV